MAQDHPRTVICGVSFSCVEKTAAAMIVQRAANDRTGGYVCVTGAHGVVIAQDHDAFRNTLNAAIMNTLDGQPVVCIARLRGYPAGRVTGREILWEVVDDDRNNQIKHILFGATSYVTDRMIARMQAMNAGVRTEAYNPPFGPISDDALDQICSEFQSSDPAILWVGLSTPKQEFLAARISERLPKIPIVAIGAGFDFVAGLKPCAPRVLTVLCLEWLFRLATEPRRLLKRYAEIVPKFLILVAKDAISHRHVRLGNVH